jgi:hypothetical protein
MTQDFCHCCILNDASSAAAPVGGAARAPEVKDARTPWIRMHLKGGALPSRFGLVVDTDDMDFVPKTVVVCSAMSEVMLLLLMMMVVVVVMIPVLLIALIVIIKTVAVVTYALVALLMIPTHLALSTPPSHALNRLFSPLPPPSMCPSQNRYLRVTHPNRTATAS